MYATRQAELHKAVAYLQAPRAAAWPNTALSCHLDCWLMLELAGLAARPERCDRPWTAREQGLWHVLAALPTGAAERTRTRDAYRAQLGAEGLMDPAEYLWAICPPDIGHCSHETSSQVLDRCVSVQRTRICTAKGRPCAAPRTEQHTRPCVCIGLGWFPTTGTNTMVPWRSLPDAVTRTLFQLDRNVGRCADRACSGTSSCAVQWDTLRLPTWLVVDQPVGYQADASGGRAPWREQTHAGWHWHDKEKGVAPVLAKQQQQTVPDRSRSVPWFRLRPPADSSVASTDDSCMASAPCYELTGLLLWNGRHFVAHVWLAGRWWRYDDVGEARLVAISDPLALPPGYQIRSWFLSRTTASLPSFAFGPEDWAGRDALVDALRPTECCHAIQWC